MINLEKEIFNKTGSAKEKLIKFYGKDVSEKTASSYLSGIKLHLDTMRRLKKNLETFDEDNIDREISFNQDKSQTIKQDVYLTQDEKASPVKKCFRRRSSASRSSKMSLWKLPDRSSFKRQIGQIFLLL